MNNTPQSTPPEDIINALQSRLNTLQGSHDSLVKSLEHARLKLSYIATAIGIALFILFGLSAVSIPGMIQEKATEVATAIAGEHAKKIATETTTNVASDIAKTETIKAASVYAKTELPEQVRLQLEERLPVTQQLASMKKEADSHMKALEKAAKDSKDIIKELGIIKSVDGAIVIDGGIYAHFLAVGTNPPNQPSILIFENGIPVFDGVYIKKDLIRFQHDSYTTVLKPGDFSMENPSEKDYLRLSIEYANGTKRPHIALKDDGNEWKVMDTVRWPSVPSEPLDYNLGGLPPPLDDK